MKNKIKNIVKVLGLLGISSLAFAPSQAEASEAEANRLLNKLYNQIDELGEITGIKSDTSRRRTGSKTTTSTVTEVKVNKKEDKEDKKEDSSYIKGLRESFETNTTTVKALEDILANYPNTIKGKEQKLVNLLVDSHSLRLQASELISRLTGENLEVSAPQIPLEYRSLVRI